MISFNLLLEYGENIPPQMTKAIPLHCLTREEVTRVLERHKYWLEIVGSTNEIPSEDDVESTLLISVTIMIMRMLIMMILMMIRSQWKSLCYQSCWLRSECSLTGHISFVLMFSRPFFSYVTVRHFNSNICQHIFTFFSTFWEKMMF